MPTPTKGRRLGSSPAHHRMLLANLATALFEHGRITTTEAKAKRLRPLAERLVTFAKRGDLQARRRALTVVRDKGVVHTLFSEIGPRYETRSGGYTRITKIGPRKGDNAPMAVIELVEAAHPEAAEAAGSPDTSETGRRGRTRRRTGTRSPQAAAGGAAAGEAAAAEAAQAETAEVEETAAEGAEAEGAEDDTEAEVQAEERPADDGEDEQKAEDQSKEG